MEKKRFDISGMTCSACSARIEKTVGKINGVKEVAVSLLTNSMTVEYDLPADDEVIMNAVRQIGYKAEIERSGNKKKTANETIILLLRFIVSFIFLIPLMYVSMGVVMFDFPMTDVLKSDPFAIAWYEFAFTLLIIAVNYKYFISGTKSLFKLSPNMDTLVSMGSGISFIYSIALMIEAYALPEKVPHLMHGLYFESAAMILTLITFGKMLESFSKGKTTSAVKELISLMPDVACIIDNGVEKEIPLKDLKVGDVFVIREGDRFPCDGEIISGYSSVNESSVTGESLPVDKKPGDSVISGTTNLNGFMTVKATKVGEEATLGKIVKLVQDAASSKAPIALIADKVSGIFVPAVIGIAIITFLIWIFVTHNAATSLSHAISVLVISCPCALGLATPVAIMVGSGRSTKFGILFKTAAALEQTGKADVIALDKTGTITKGEPTVTDIVTLSELSENNVLSLAASLEMGSNHPISCAIIKKAKDNQIKTAALTDFQSLTGHGLVGITENGSKVFLGNNALLNKFDIAITNEAETAAVNLSLCGKTPLYLAIDYDVKGIIAISDEIKNDSVKAISDLKKEGFGVVMITGDNEICAKYVAKECGVDTVIANVLPDEKNSAIKNLQNFGKVIMVGDGINDAPALTQADVGIAIGQGTDVAIDSADVVLIKSSLADVVKAVNISRKTLTNVKENLFWAFIYNCICIPIAAGILSMPPVNLNLSPMFAAGAMSLSSVCVVLNALRLNFVNPDKPTHRNGKRHKKIAADNVGTSTSIPSLSIPSLKNIKSSTEHYNPDVCDASDSAICSDATNYKISTDNENNIIVAVQNKNVKTGTQNKNGNKKISEGGNMKKQIYIEGMMCSHCSSHVKNALMNISGVIDVEVSLESKRATITTSKEIDDATITNVIKEAGYSVTKIN